MKTCYKCKKVKEFSDFSKLTKSLDGFQAVCKSCNTIQQRSWRQRNKEKHKINSRKSYHKNNEKIKNTYGISAKTYYELNNINFSYFHDFDKD